MHPTRNDIPQATRDKICQLLDPRLAEALDLYARCKDAHWNVKGAQFAELHRLFDAVAADTLTYADDVAERLVQLGGTAVGNPREVAKRSTLPMKVGGIPDWQAHVKNVSDALAFFAKSVRGGIDEATELGDMGTADLLTEISRGVDKWLWQVESHLQG